jgi:guanylate kinase
LQRKKHEDLIPHFILDRARVHWLLSYLKNIQQHLLLVYLVCWFRIFYYHFDCLFFYLSDTTRSPRTGEQDGRGMCNVFISQGFEFYFNRISFCFSTWYGENACSWWISWINWILIESLWNKVIAQKNRIRFIPNEFFCYFSKKAVEDVTQTGRICLLDVDKQGVKNIRKTDLNALFIYISPPSYEILEQRLRGRQTDSDAAIEKRLKEAKESMEFSKEPGMYDHIILNDKLEVAYQTLKDILHKVKQTFSVKFYNWSCF